jgi:hypothetical protein
MEVAPGAFRRSDNPCCLVEIRLDEAFGDFVRR